MRGGMGLRIIISILLVISIFSPPMSGALTTFGKSNPTQNQNPPPPPTPMGRARECKMDNDCGGILNTTCLSDPRDGRTRCLCGDYSIPVNGACPNKFKALGSFCNDNRECVEDAHCVQHNNTMGRRCYCKEGFVQEAPLICSGCSSVFTLYTTTILVASFMLGRLNYI